MTNSYGPSIVRDGLVLCLDAADRNCYTGSGSTVYDLSGNGNNGSMTNVSYSTNNRGYFTFNGSNSIIYIGSPSYTTFTSFSYNAWVRANSGALGYRTIIDLQNDNFLFAAQNYYFILYDPNFNTGYTLAANQWYNLSISHDHSSAGYFYVNGNLVYTSSNFSNSHTITSYGIGAGVSSPTGGNEVWAGNIAQASIYNRGLTASEILQNYNATKGRFGL